MIEPPSDGFDGSPGRTHITEDVWRELCYRVEKCRPCTRYCADAWNCFGHRGSAPRKPAAPTADFVVARSDVEDVDKWFDEADPKTRRFEAAWCK